MISQLLTGENLLFGGNNFIKNNKNHIKYVFNILTLLALYLCKSQNFGNL